ncbi:MAG TPA: bifunctional diguanylate cyclase/phosphodiesterase [Mycobacteriales bacterium]|nr:bifunctional diguanylate cyclase/phosphodiesterase [Mycobacteriales bacterium]
MRRRFVESRGVARTAVAGLALGLLALALLAWWGAASTQRATAQVRAMNEVSAGWQRLYDRILAIDDALGDYVRAGSDIGRRPLISAVTAATQSLDWLRQHRDPDEADEVSDVGQSFAGYATTLQTLFDAGRRGDVKQTPILIEQAALSSAALHKQVAADMERRRLATADLLDQVDQGVRRLRNAAPVTLAVDSVLLLVCALVLLGYQRRVEGQSASNQHQALHDSLTGLANRVLLGSRTEQAIADAGRAGAGPVALLLIDLDRFKEVNDTLGHHAGDVLLQEVAARLRRAVRAGDTVARLGGDEFSVLLPGGVPVDALAVAHRVLALVREPIQIDGLPVEVSASIGMAAHPADSADAAELLQHADIAMYAAKRGQAGVISYDPALNEHSRRHLTMLAELRQAIGRGDLILHYQPKVRGPAAELSGVEALVRWQHAEHGLIGPGEFIPMAEQTDLIELLTWHVLETALDQCRRWQQAGRQLPIAVNVATRCLLNPSFPGDLATMLVRHGVSPQLLTLEVTETMLISDPPRMAQMLGSLRALGVRLSLDDFGTGYSSMSYLRELPVDELKIDQKFIASLCSSRSDAAIVRAVLDLGSNLGLDVVAEGVEDAGTWAALVDLGCRYGQGYHFARPMPAEALADWQANRPAQATTADRSSLAGRVDNMPSRS